jgi:hypothetical protein
MKKNLKNECLTGRNVFPPKLIINQSKTISPKEIRQGGGGSAGPCGVKIIIG